MVAAPSDGRAFAYLRTPTDGRAFAHPRTPMDSGEDSGSTADRGDAAGRPQLIAMNPGRGTETVKLPDGLRSDASPILALGSPTISGRTLTLPAQSFAVLG